MKKVYNLIQKLPLNPVMLIIIFTLIGVFVLCMFQTNEEVFEYFLTFIGIGISAAVVQCAVIQNRIEKDNIKIQLFDKRYAVFQALLDSITIIQRDNWDRYILFNDEDANRQVIQVEENLYRATYLSACLFDNNLHSKLVKVNNAFCKVAQSYKEMLIANLTNLGSQEDVQEFIALFKSHLLSQKGLDSIEYEENLKERFPKTYICLMDFSKECNTYITFVEGCGILEDFKEYINVNGLEI